MTRRPSTDVIRLTLIWRGGFHVVAWHGPRGPDRAAKEEKRLLATAAAYELLDVTNFIMRNVLPAARKVVDRAERIVLSARDTARVLALLGNPPKPTPALLAAARRRAPRK